MAYKIRYDTATKPEKTNHFRVQVLTATFFLAFLLVVTAFWEQGRQVIRNYLLPEEGKVVNAAEALATELENGTSFFDAMEVFCESIINGES